MIETKHPFKLTTLALFLTGVAEWNFKAEQAYRFRGGARMAPAAYAGLPPVLRTQFAGWLESYEALVGADLMPTGDDDEDTAFQQGNEGNDNGVGEGPSVVSNPNPVYVPGEQLAKDAAGEGGASETATPSVVEQQTLNEGGTSARDPRDVASDPEGKAVVNASEPLVAAKATTGKGKGGKGKK